MLVDASYRFIYRYRTVYRRTFVCHHHTTHTRLPHAARAVTRATPTRCCVSLVDLVCYAFYHAATHRCGLPRLFAFDVLGSHTHFTLPTPPPHPRTFRTVSLHRLARATATLPATVADTCRVPTHHYLTTTPCRLPFVLLRRPDILLIPLPTLPTLTGSRIPTRAARCAGLTARAPLPFRFADILRATKHAFAAGLRRIPLILRCRFYRALPYAV